jgi:hypothetical protein
MALFREVNESEEQRCYYNAAVAVQLLANEMLKEPSGR